MSIFDGFGSRFGSQDGAKIDEKRCWKNDEKTMTTKMAKKRIYAATAPFGTTILEPGEEVGGGVNHSSKEVGGSWKDET